MSWLEARRSAFRGLRGRSVSAWFGADFAFYERGPEEAPGPCFTHPEIACRQLSYLDLRIGGDTFRVCALQNDDSWSLGIDAVEAGPVGTAEPNSIYGPRRPLALPSGRIDEVTLGLDDDGAVLDVELSFAAEAPVLLRAAEFHEEAYPAGRWVIGDESILVFRDRRARDALAWVGPAPKAG